MPGERGRLTIPGLMLLLASFAFLAPLALLLYDVMQLRIGYLSTGELLLLQALVPLGLIVLLTVAYARATEGL
jgi:hypothetical protein